MKNKIKTTYKAITGILILIILYAVFRLIYAGGNYLVNRSQPHDRTRYDVVVECQKISATATNETWGYKGCLSELIKYIPTEAKLLKTL